MTGRSTSRVRAVIPALLLAANVWVAAGVPVFHGETEVLSSQAAFESGHTDRCAVLHIESRCTVSAMHLVVAATARDLALVRQPVVALPAPATGALLHLPSSSSANTVRAPPVA